MKRNNDILVKLKELFLMNRSIEGTYKIVSKHTTDDSLKVFFKQKAYEKKKFGEKLDSEIKKIKESAENIEVKVKKISFLKRRLNNLLETNDEADMINVVYRIEQLAVGRYNALLREINLPLSICKLLIRQLDHIETELSSIEKVKVYAV